MEKDENKRRACTCHVAKDIDDGEISFNDHDEGRGSEGETIGKQESRATSSADVHIADTSGNSSNMAIRGTSKILVTNKVQRSQQVRDKPRGQQIGAWHSEATKRSGNNQEAKVEVLAPGATKMLTSAMNHKKQTLQVPQSARRKRCQFNDPDFLLVNASDTNDEIHRRQSRNGQISKGDRHIMANDVARAFWEVCE